LPNQKVRSSNRNPSHYNQNSGVIVGRKTRQARFGKGITLRKETDGVTGKRLSPYMGSLITPQTRRAYEARQIEYFEARFIADTLAKREAIQNSTDKTDEQIKDAIYEFNLEQPNEEQLREMAKRFATHQRNKEAAHYKAWQRGQDNFRYMGNNFPVMTRAFLDKTSGIKEIEDLQEKIDQSLEEAVVN